MKTVKYLNGFKKLIFAVKIPKYNFIHKHPDSDCLSFSARMAALQEDNKNLELGLSKMEGERKQAQERSNNLEKVSSFIFTYTGHK